MVNSHRVCRSPPINVEDIGVVHFRLKHPVDESTHLIAVDVKLGGSTIFVVISRADDAWPFIIENESDYTFTFYQTVSRPHSLLCPVLTVLQDADHADVDIHRTLPTYTSRSKTTADYAWDYPAGRDKKLMLRVNDSRRPIDVMEIGDLMPFKFMVRVFQLLGYLALRDLAGSSGCSGSLVGRSGRSAQADHPHHELQP